MPHGKYIINKGSNQWYLIAGITNETPQQSADRVTDTSIVKCTVQFAYADRRNIEDGYGSLSFQEIKNNNYPVSQWYKIEKEDILLFYMGLWIKCDVSGAEPVSEPAVDNIVPELIHFMNLLKIKDSEYVDNLPELVHYMNLLSEKNRDT